MIEDERREVEAIRKNQKFFNAYAKRFIKVKLKIGPLSKPNGEYTYNPKEMADSLQNQYKNVLNVSSAVLMKKLNKIGIKGKLWNWFRSFLRDRQQVVIVERCYFICNTSSLRCASRISIGTSAVSYYGR